MSTSERTMNQVRSILHKLDRSIDEAREKRTQQRVGTHATVVAPVREVPPAPAAAAAPSQYGRAQPMPASRNGAAPRWGT
ncbi:MAG: hypothetical protein ACKVU4_15060 [Phycisphaerales bacterium]